MLFKDVNVPEELISANRDGKLVVFAGAGISMDPPSSLPDFRKLADMVAGGALPRERPDEPDDRFLGRLEKHGVEVQKRVRDILGLPSSQPGPLHHGLCDLFSSADTLRIVTTNFDKHLTTVATAKHGASIDVFSAPAMPLGRDFTGLVYLHGSLARREPLTLTDGDFGRAYLTDGWATRFLLEMLKKFTVLFVGYSHSDTVMQYLARGFVGESKRFALSLEADNERWAYLGIQHVAYPARPDPDRHGALPEAIAAWSAHARMGLFDHETRLQALLQAPPPIDQDALDYLDAMTKESTTLRLFTNHARSVEWLEWADKRGLLDVLFDPQDAETERSGILADWITDRFALTHLDAALGVVERRVPRISWSLWVRLGRKIAVEKPRPTHEIISRWVVLLIGTALPSWNTMYLGMLLDEATAVEELEAVLILFKYLTQPRLAYDRLSQFWKGESEKARVHVDVVLAGEDYNLRRVWKGFFATHMASAYEELTTLLTQHLREAYWLMVAAGKADRIWDPMSFKRSAIEPHGQDAYADAWEFLVDAARDVLEWTITNKPEVASATIAEWLTASAPLLTRLGVHGVTFDTRLSPDEKLQLVQSNQWVHSFPLKHEVFQLLKQNFGQAGDEAQKAFIVHAESVLVAPESRDGVPRHVTDYEAYNLAAWLSSAAPQSMPAKDYFERLQKEHADFTPRDNADFDAWTSAVTLRSPKSPITVTDLLQRPFPEVVAWLLNWRQEAPGFDEPTREGVLTTVREAALQSFDWSTRLAEGLALQSAFEADLWTALLESWRDGKLEMPQVQSVLTFLRNNPGVDAQSNGIANVMDRVTEKPDSLTSEMVTEVETVCDRLLATAGSPSSIVTSDGSDDWLTRAINQVGGRLTIVLVKLIARHQVEGAPRTLPKAYQERFERLLNGTGPNGTFGRVVLASQVNYLFALDAEWTKRWVLPLFDWTRDTTKATQAWAGFAGWGQWTEALFEVLLPYTRQMFKHLDKELEHDRQHLTSRLAGAAAFSRQDPWKDGWLKDFIRDVAPPTASAWAEALTRILDELTEEGQHRLWDLWLKAFWGDRLDGVPRPFSPPEREQAFAWAIALKFEFEAAVQMCERTPAPTGDLDQFVVFRLNQSGLAREKPIAAARLTKHLIQAASGSGYSCPYLVEIVTAALQAGGDKGDLLVICNEMVRLGCGEASDLRQHLA